jgi:hypothetical protein
MSGDDAEQHLGEEQGGDDEEILGGCPHRRRDRGGAEQVRRRKALERLEVAPPDVELARIIPDERPDAAEQNENGDEGPHEGRARRRVADQRLMRPVAGIADRVSGPFSGRCPGRPEEEGGQRMGLVRVQNRALRHRIELAQMLVCRRAVGEQTLEVRGRRPDGGRALIADREDRGSRIVAIGAHFTPQDGADPRLFGFRQRRERRLGTGPGEPVAQEGRFAVQPVSAPVGRDIAAMPPDRALLHAAGRLPHRLAALDVVAGVEDLPRDGPHHARDRRLGMIDLDAEIEQHAEHDHHRRAKDDP